MKQRRKIKAKETLEPEMPSHKSFEPWAPPTFTAFKLLLSARLCSAIWSNISDCDETFNYWEPMHYLIHGTGFQTWEYSPAYAIRSYFYLWLHAAPLKIYSYILFVPKILQLYILRCFLGCMCTVCELYFYKAVCKQYGNNPGRLTLTFMMLSPAMFISSCAFMPSSFAMYTVLLAYGGWFNREYPVAVLGIAAASIVGWPFAGLLGLPIAFDIIFYRKQYWFFAQWVVFSGLFCGLPMLLVDSYYFGGIVAAPLNIVLYNVFTSHGPDLYGTEEWPFYFINGFLNFNIAFPLALISMPLCVGIALLKGFFGSRKIIFRFLSGRPYKALQLSLIGMYIWMLVFFTRPHKEERFLFPIYPLICFAAAASLDFCQRIYAAIVSSPDKQHYIQPSWIISVITCTFFGVLSVSRIIALYQGYHAPLEVYGKFLELSQDPEIHSMPSERDVNVCVGKEWYRFPSHFAFPSNNWHLQFIKSEFKGQLPKPYEQGADATKIIPTHMNDLNLEEPTRYINISKCHYLVDVNTTRESTLEPRYALRENEWKTVYSAPFLDAANSHRIFRAFYVPFVSHKYCTYVNYNILKTTRTKRHK